MENPTTSELSYNTPLTVADVLRQILPRLVEGHSKIPAWPADVFAVAASLLQRGGAYASAMDRWPPSGLEATFIEEVRDQGREWRLHWEDGGFSYLEDAWHQLISKTGLCLDEICRDVRLLQSLVLMCAVADEACSRVGVSPVDADEPGSGADDEIEFYLKAQELLDESSLCLEIHPSRLKVLPKMHTPQTGLTIRSFTLNLALITSGEIEPKWLTYPSPFLNDIWRILFVPWPLSVDSEDFRPSPRLPGEMANMSSRFDFFEYFPQDPGDPVEYVTALLEAAQKRGVEINAVLLPELAISDEEFEALRRRVVEERGRVLIAGARSPHTEDVRCKNEARMAIPNYDELSQAKHHRWKLDRSQIDQYELNGLDKDKCWWEHIDLTSRECMFVSLGRDSGLVVSVLVCEDLARPDPVGDLIRAVAPNLVIALLMDGPQLKGRWSARYAATLANDPGSSVLSVTSLGMSLRSKARNGYTGRNRVVGLWHSADGNFQELEMSEGSGALVLTLQRTYDTEWTADGRSGNANAACVRLTHWEDFLPLDATE